MSCSGTKSIAGILKPFTPVSSLFPHFSVTSSFLFFFFLLIRALICLILGCLIRALICLILLLQYLKQATPYSIVNIMFQGCVYFYEYIPFLRHSSSTARTTIPVTWTFNHFIRRYFEHLAFHWLWSSFFCGCCLWGEERGTVESFCIVTSCQRFSFTVTVGRSEEGLALCHFSGQACFIDMWLGVSVAD